MPQLQGSSYHEAASTRRNCGDRPTMPCPTNNKIVPDEQKYAYRTRIVHTPQITPKAFLNNALPHRT